MRTKIDNRVLQVTPQVNCRRLIKNNSKQTKLENNRYKFVIEKQNPISRKPSVEMISVRQGMSKQSSVENALRFVQTKGKLRPTSHTKLNTKILNQDIEMDEF